MDPSITQFPTFESLVPIKLPDNEHSPALQVAKFILEQSTINETAFSNSQAIIAEKITPAKSKRKISQRTQNDSNHLNDEESNNERTLKKPKDQGSIKFSSCSSNNQAIKSENNTLTKPEIKKSERKKKVSKEKMLKKPKVQEFSLKKAASSIEIFPSLSVSSSTSSETAISIREMSQEATNIFNKQQRYLAAIERNPLFALPYLGLAEILPVLGQPGITLLNGTFMSQHDLLIKAIDRAPKLGKAYFYLAITLPEGVKISLLNGEKMDKYDLFHKAVEYDIQTVRSFLKCDPPSPEI